MAFKIITKQIKKEILNFVKNLVNKSTYNDINTLLTPCCKPTLEIEAGNFSCTGNSYTLFENVNVTTNYKNKPVTLLFTFTQVGSNTYTSALNVTTDANGVWSESVTMWSWVTSGTVDVTVGVIIEGSQVVITSDPITVTGVPNCD